MLLNSLETYFFLSCYLQDSEYPKIPAQLTQLSPAVGLPVKWVVVCFSLRICVKFSAEWASLGNWGLLCPQRTDIKQYRFFFFSLTFIKSDFKGLAEKKVIVWPIHYLSSPFKKLPLAVTVNTTDVYWESGYGQTFKQSSGDKNFRWFWSCLVVKCRPLCWLVSQLSSAGSLYTSFAPWIFSSILFFFFKFSSCLVNGEDVATNLSFSYLISPPSSCSPRVLSKFSAVRNRGGPLKQNSPRIWKEASQWEP